MSLPRFVSSLKPGQTCLLLLDYDGTCAAIHRDRRRAKLSRPWSALLRQLAQAPNLRLAFISGRGLADLRHHVPIPGAAWVGSHGLEWWSPKLGPSLALRRSWRARNQGALRALRPLKQRYRSMDIEAKGPDLSLHLRALSPAQRARLRLDLSPLLDRYRLALHLGRSVFELRPKDGWNKGKVVRRLRRAWGLQHPCLFAGDDRTDEDGFRALAGARHCLGYKVGAGPTKAKQQGTRRQLWALLNAVIQKTQTKE